ncbi:hypothetical protein F2Q69_00014745 [Brassica cretica]|uniref:Uncharacterized protein n=1 Tax=Brassica cretica TaxID=69181 RepID=A0A8S9QYT9_BRACR|nr:hypothetical protein F2Q69_00014745 [Brassica cretica]
MVHGGLWCGVKTRWWDGFLRWRGGSFRPRFDSGRGGFYSSVVAGNFREVEALFAPPPSVLSSGGGGLPSSVVAVLSPEGGGYGSSTLPVWFRLQTEERLHQASKRGRDYDSVGAIVLKQIRMSDTWQLLRQQLIDNGTRPTPPLDLASAELKNLYSVVSDLYPI